MQEAMQPIQIRITPEDAKNKLLPKLQAEAVKKDPTVVVSLHGSLMNPFAFEVHFTCSTGTDIYSVDSITGKWERVIYVQ